MAERAAPPKATDKLTFLLALVPYLIDQVRVTVDEAAAHFETTPAHMRAYVELIAMSGTPGADGGYTHESLFDIDWDDFERGVIRVRQAPMEEIPRLSGREAAALLAGLQRVATLPAFTAGVDVAALMAKLARGASDSPAPLAVRPSATADLHALLATAVAERRRLRIDYVTARGDRELRDIDPIRLDDIDEARYIRAWCLSREAERTFLLDRIASAEMLGAAEAHESASSPDELFHSDISDELVTLALPAAALPLIADYRGADDAVRIEGDRAIVTLPIAHPGVLGRLAARLSGELEVREPASAREALVAWARAALDAAE